MDTTPESASIEKPSEKKSSAGSLIAIVAVLVVVGLWALGRYTSVNVPGVPKAGEGAQKAMEVSEPVGETGEWQAVFLSNGQVYFGKLKNASSQYASLNEVYYLQVQQQLQQATGTTTGQVVGVEQQNAQQQLVLIKFGTELHGPEDQMTINRDHILFWENLKGDSTVVRSIVQYKNPPQE